MALAVLMRVRAGRDWGVRVCGAVDLLGHADADLGIDLRRR